jgi:aspartate dehydrogenase
MRTRRIAVIGLGAIGRPVAERLAAGAIAGAELVGVMRRAAPDGSSAGGVPGGCRLADLAAVVAAAPDVVVEAAGAEAFRAVVPALLARGIDVVAVSLAAMADVAVEAAVTTATATGGGRLLIASGAIGGLDALTAAREAGLDAVTLTQRKPPRAFPGRDLPAGVATIVSDGSARDAALAFPKNANIAAAVALAGIGFDRTRVTVVADPAVDANIAELQARGAFGTLTVALANRPSPDNPSTARLAGLSVVAALRRLAAPLVAPA